jgi:uncharacterized protein
VECQRTDAPGVTPSMKTAIADLQLDRLPAVDPGAQRDALAEHLEAVPLAAVID